MNYNLVCLRTLKIELNTKMLNNFKKTDVKYFKLQFFGIFDILGF